MIDVARALLDQRGVDPSAASALSEVLDMLPGRTFPEGTVLCEEGAEGVEMWVLVQGRVSVRKRDLTGVARPLARVTGPAMLGHMALAGGWDRSASCVALDDVRALLVSKDHFDTLMGEIGPNGDIFRRVLIAGMSRQLATGNAKLRQLLVPFEDSDTEMMDRSVLDTQATFDGWVG